MLVLLHNYLFWKFVFWSSKKEYISYCLKFLIKLVIFLITSHASIYICFVLWWWKTTGVVTKAKAADQSRDQSMSSIVKGIVIRSTPDVCSNNNRLIFNGNNYKYVQHSDYIAVRCGGGRRRTYTRLQQNTWKAKPQIRGQAILTPATPPTTKKVHYIH